ncbi:MAG: DUF4169 family protein [Pseudolabrys sp.]
MADLINLRMARKQARQRQDEARALANRLAYGQPKRQRKLDAARQKKARGDLEQHKIDKGDGR